MRESGTDTSKTVINQQPLLLERFRVVRILGEGAAGAVYHVEDRGQSPYREVALKVLTNRAAFDENTLDRFKEELRVCQKIRHVNIVEAYELIELDDAIAFTMEYVDGCDLGRLLKRRALDHDLITRVMAQVFAALGELHSHGILHRDIKLENILLRNDGVVKLGDLGLLKNLYKKGLTRAGVLLGTAQYLPPEYVRTGVFDARGDLYAAGVVLFELLTGRHRLAEKTGKEIIPYLIKTQFKLPAGELAGLPVQFRRIIERCVASNPKERFQAAIEAQEALSSKELPLIESPQSSGVFQGRFSEALCAKAARLGPQYGVLRFTLNLTMTIGVIALAVGLLSAFWFSR